jgi:hypothetical protein
MRLLVVAASLAISSSAFAQAPGEIQPLAQPGQPRKDPTVAVVLSVGATVAGFAMVASSASSSNGGLTTLGIVGMYFGPSAGQWYAGSVGGIGLVSRAVAAIAIIKGVDMMDQSAEIDCFPGDNCSGLTDEANRLERRGAYYFSGGLALWGASTLYDFVAAHRAASRWNREHALTVVPIVPTARGTATGVTVGLRF